MVALERARSEQRTSIPLQHGSASSDLEGKTRDFSIFPIGMLGQRCSLLSFPLNIGTATIEEKNHSALALGLGVLVCGFDVQQVRLYRAHRQDQSIMHSNIKQQHTLLHPRFPSKVGKHAECIGHSQNVS